MTDKTGGSAFPVPATELHGTKEHRRVFNQETLQALVSNGFDEKLATEFIKLVASNQIPHMTMNY